MEKKLIIITAPSGAGKTSITKFLLAKYNFLEFSISATTRQPRNEEQHGKDYYFLPLAAFEQHIQQHDFIEWEMVYEGKYYGTLKTELERIWAENKTPILDIDVKGAIQVQQKFKHNSLSIFIEPPSVNALKERLLSRGTETEETLQARVNKASYEISFKHHFNISIINDDLEKACIETENTIVSFLK
jgi:guanylate kinase